MPTALGSACRPTRASVLLSHIEGLITSLSVLVQWLLLYAAPQVLKPFALPCQISPPHNRANRVSQELPTYTPSQAAYVQRVRSHLPKQCFVFPSPACCPKLFLTCCTRRARVSVAENRPAIPAFIRLPQPNASLKHSIPDPKHPYEP
jgi:hypothetical protein